ncbi:hypothetical protein ACFLYY_02465 [Patescibacteria group bacterium]
MFNEIIPPQILDFFSSQDFINFMSILKIVFLIISAIFLAFIIFALIKTLYLKRLFLWNLQEMKNFRPFGIKKLNKKWLKVKGGLKEGLESQYKLSVIEADSIMDDILRRMGFMGETLSERLEKITVATMPNLNEIIEAHQVRDKVVHDPNYKLSLEKAKTVIESFEKALTDLQAL